MKNEPLKAIVSTLKNLGTRNAFCIDGKFHTYAELAQCISKIRKALQKATFESGNIGLVANDDLETYASIYAIWLEGLAYVPLHPLHPIERNQEIIVQADIKVVLSSDNAVQFSCVETIETRNLVFEDFLLNPKEIDEESLACILFTSGSTGTPKGVTITYSNINAFVQAFFAIGYVIDETDKFLQPTDLNFAMSIRSYLIPALKGACVYTVPYNQIKYSYVAELLEEHSLTFVSMAPSIIRYLSPFFDEINLPALRYCLFSGESLPLDLLLEWSKCVPNAVIDNCYGNTENGGMCFVYRFVRDGNNKSYNGILSIGKPTAGKEILIIDDTDSPVTSNVHGELSIAGKQLTPGYLNNPDKNKEAFFTHNNTHFYRTGDICYQDEDGDVLYCGRLDSQVKISGCRIELGEIEYHVREFLFGTNAVCVTSENEGNTEIVLFVESPDCDSKALTGYLQSKLPSYMIPKTIVSCAEFPLTVNGKIDRMTLKNGV